MLVKKVAIVAALFWKSLRNFAGQTMLSMMADARGKAWVGTRLRKLDDGFRGIIEA